MSVPLRPASQVMRLERLGASHPTRLSFLRAMMRRAQAEAWRVHWSRWAISDEGFGHAVLQVDMPQRSYSLVAFATPLADAQRTDRVIAEAWDTSYVLYDGIPDDRAIARLALNAPLQEAGRFTERDLILSRANKSVRLFAHVVESLAAGRQPDAALLAEVGYLMRTTAVYGNGKFGIADRDCIERRAEFAAPFRAEMLTVWLIRSFTVALAEHVARRRAPRTAVVLAPALRRKLGVGNSTGLGMAPFLVRHPLLMARWFLARETALARVRALRGADRATRAVFAQALARAQDNLARWQTQDPGQLTANASLKRDLDALAQEWRAVMEGADRPWDALYRHAEAHFSLEGQEATAALLLEPHGALVDDLAEAMAADETTTGGIDGTTSCRTLLSLIDTHYGWTRAYAFATPEAQARFWYVSAEKLEPRLGERWQEEGAALEQPLAIARDIVAMRDALAQEEADGTVASFAMRHPQWRHLLRRIAIANSEAYAEIQGNLVDAAMRPIDLLRCKLAFFGASRFDPRSDRWLRISLFADAPYPEDIAALRTAA